MKKKIWNAFTGGRDTVEEHRRLGCRTEVCVVCKYQSIFFGRDDVVEKCRKGEMLSGENKKLLMEEIWEVLESHQREREKAREKVERFVPGLEDALGQ